MSETSQSDGRFSILAKAGDELFLISKIHVDKKLILEKNDFHTELTISLEKKPVELEEVDIKNNGQVKFKISQSEINARDLVKLQKEASKAAVQGVYTGQTVNGMDFMRMAKDIYRLFKKKDDDKIPPKPIIDFKEYVKDNYKDSFFTDSLQLKPDQIYAFIDYCNDDPKAKAIVQNNNSLAVMDFLLLKNKAFKKLESEAKK